MFIHILLILHRPNTATHLSSYGICKNEERHDWDVTIAWHGTAPRSNQQSFGDEWNIVGIGPLPLMSHPAAPTSNPFRLNGNLNPLQIMARPIAPTNNPLGMNRSIEMNSPMPRQVQPVGFDIPSSFVNQPSLHSWEASLHFMPPTGPVDSILIGLLQRQRSLALDGTT